MRECYCCGTTSSRYGKNIHQQWYLNHGTPFALCMVCSNKLFNRLNRMKYESKRRPRRLYFKGKRFDSHRSNIRIGVCNLCRAVTPFDTKYTQLHHEKYDEKNPMNHILEICLSCHSKTKWERGEMRGENISKGKPLAGIEKKCHLCGTIKTTVREKKQKSGKITIYDEWHLYENKYRICTSCYGKQRYLIYT